MLHTIINQSLTRYAVHLHGHSQLIRLSSITLRKDKFSHISPFPATGKSFGRRSCSTFSASNDRNNGGEYKSNPWHSKALGTLIGALGTVAVLGLGTVLGKSQEERKGCEETVKDEEAEVGKDVVGLEWKHGNEEISSDTRLHAEPSDSWNVKLTDQLSRHEESVRKARQILRRHMEEVGAPGMVVAVTVNGKQVWTDGFGFADLENGVRCSPMTVMRIASISKAITMTAVAKLWEDGKLDLDAPIQKYVPNFPVKTYNGEEVTITTRQLISHKSGIRHYKLKDPKNKENKKKENDQSNDGSKAQTADHKGTAVTVPIKDDKLATGKVSLKERENISIGSETDLEEKLILTPNKDNENISCSKKIKQPEEKDKNEKCTCSKNVHKRRKGKKKKKEEEDDDEFDLKEYYIKEEYETIQDALELFQNDELFHKPGEGFLYTTHGWTVVSAVVEGAAQKPFTEVIRRLFFELGLNNTYLDKSSPIIYRRASYYIRDKHGRLKNAPYVDNSYKWAGGGFLSTVGDLCKFGNAMLYASQHECKDEDTPKLPGYLKASTIQHLWTPVDGTNRGWQDRTYGMGWEAIQDKCFYEFCRNTRHHAYHTGAAVGASSILLILPQKESSGAIPEGVVVALLTNMQGVGLHKVALEIAELFENKESIKYSS